MDPVQWPKVIKECDTSDSMVLFSYIFIGEFLIQNKLKVKEISIKN